MREAVLKRNFYSRDTALVARELLGKTLVRTVSGRYLAGSIIETEAYYGLDDPASHAFRGSTPRSRIMFGKAGMAYVYLCYGVYWLLNVVTEKEGTPGAVLIRGIRPFSGMEEMKKARNTDKGLCDGPGKLTVAMSLDARYNGIDMTDKGSGLYIAENPEIDRGFEIRNTSRVGISAGKERMLRYQAVGL